MKEFVTANNRIFECTSVATGLNSITMKMENQDADDVEAFFRDVTGLTVTFEGEEAPHGVYTEPRFSLAFESITKFEDGSVAVTMHIKSEIERRLDALEAGQKALETEQAVQNGAIAEIGTMLGGEV